MEKTIIFIHGMFQNPKSWGNWINYFEQKGYKCLAPAWPYHEGEPAALRTYVPEGLGDLRLQSIIEKYASIILSLPEKPILIGHSVGGLIVQILINNGMAESGVCISSVAPNKMLSFDWGLFKNSFMISNPLKGDAPFIMSSDEFHENFCNTMSLEESNKAYEEFATNDSRNVFRDCLTEDGHVDLKKPHQPLLFISGEKDQIIPPSLNQKNFEAYENTNSKKEIRVFPNRGHFICGQPGWEEVASYILNWLTNTSINNRPPFRLDDSLKKDSTVTKNKTQI